MREMPILLSDEDWEAINQKAGVDVMDIVVNLDNEYTKPQQADLIVKRCDLATRAQLKKVYEHFEWLIMGPKGEITWDDMKSLKKEAYETGD